MNGIHIPSFVIPEAAKAAVRNPWTQHGGCRKMDSGLAASRRPGMTVER
jgi:hypothetical protein